MINRYAFGNVFHVYSSIKNGNHHGQLANRTKEVLQPASEEDKECPVVDSASRSELGIPRIRWLILNNTKHKS